MNVRHESAITSSVFCGSSLLLITSLIKEPPVALVLDVVDKRTLSLLVKSMYSLSVEAELESLLGFEALVGTRIWFPTREQSRSQLIVPSEFSQALPLSN